MNEPVLRPDTIDASDASDRRRRRSDDPLVALHYQLSTSRTRGELDAIVVADASGVVVAGAGSWPVCEELAAYAPLLAASPELRRDAVVRSVDVGGQEILLCVRVRGEAAPANMEHELDRAAAGITRILAAA